MLPDIMTAIEALAKALRRSYEEIYIANALFSIPLHTDDQDQLALCVMGCNILVMSFHKARSWKKSYSLTALAFRYINNTLLVGPSKATTRQGLDAKLTHIH